MDADRLRDYVSRWRLSRQIPHARYSSLFESPSEMRIRRHEIRRISAYALIVTAATVLSIALGNLSFFRSFDLRAQDLQFLLRGKVKAAPEVKLLVVDQKTYDNIPDLQMFWHPLYAEAMRAAADARARVMALDITFTVPVQKWEPDHDRVLAQAAAETAARMPVIIGYVPTALNKQQEWPVPVNMIMSALGLAAFVNLTADTDSFIRRQELFEEPQRNDPSGFARSLALRTVEKYLGTDASFDGRTLTLAGRHVPISDERAIPINYAGPAGTFPSVSLWDFLQASRAGDLQKLRNWVEGKIVILGVDGVTDRYPTPYYTPFAGARWTTAGVEIHASTIGTILSQQYLKPIPPWSQAAAGLAIAIVTVSAVAFLGDIAAPSCVVLVLLVIVMTTHILFRAGLTASASQLLLACGSSVIMTGVYRLSTSQKRTELFGRALRAFVGREITSTLDHSGEISLSGRRVFATILFSDIRGFTTFCEQKDPAVVVDVLNAYLAQMVGIISRHGGVVNKFIGDGILAVFSDGDDGAVRGDHPSRAVRCGIEICLAETGFSTGVGINTGVVVIGTIGSADRVEYTVLGDTVNVASRVESLNKEQRTRLLMSQSTRELLEPDIRTVFLEAVHLRGQSRATRIYTAAVLTTAHASGAAGS